jgi:hypothetical protein
MGTGRYVGITHRAENKKKPGVAGLVLYVSVNQLLSEHKYTD